VAIRCDEVRLDGPKRTPQGGLKAAAFLTRAGVFEYSQPDGSVVRELRPEDEVFKADSMGSLASAPLTRLHPARPVDAKSYTKVSVGHVGETVTKDGDKVAATVYVQDADAVAAIERGDMRQVSCGYRCDIDPTPGVTADGQAYDRVQRNIFYNHVALVPVGRAGAGVALRLDAAGDSITPSGATMSEIKKDETDVRVELAVAKADLVKQTERADAAEAKNAELTKAIAEMPAKIAARATLEAKAAKVIGSEFKADGLSDEQVKDAIVEHAAKVEKTDAAPAKALIATVEVKSDAADAVDPVKARAAMVERNRNAWKQESK
jgi:hypothetical protein